MSARPLSILTRILHLMLLLAVLHQLISSTFMEGPKPGLPEDPLYELHQWGGLTSLGLVSLFWLWTLVRRGETSLGALVPWFSSARLAAVRTDLKLHGRALIRFRLPDDRLGALASAVHGLGLLTVTTMAVTGAASLVATTALAEPIIEFHKIMANFMWAYLVAHASLAVIHHLGGSDVLRQMFSSKTGANAT